MSFVSSRSNALPSATLPFSIYLLSLCSFAFGLCEFIAAGLLTPMARDLHASVAAAGGAIAAYALGAAIGAPILTALLARHSERRLLVAAMAVLAAGGLAMAVAPALGALLGVRFVVGLAHGVFMAVASHAATSLVDPSRAGRALSVVWLGLTLALAGGVPLGTWLGAVASWRWVFAAIGVLALCGGAGLLRAMPRVHRRRIGPGQPARHPAAGAAAGGRRGGAGQRGHFQLFHVCLALPAAAGRTRWGLAGRRHAVLWRVRHRRQPAGRLVRGSSFRAACRHAGAGRAGAQPAGLLCAARLARRLAGPVRQPGPAVLCPRHPVHRALAAPGAAALPGQRCRGGRLEHRRLQCGDGRRWSAGRQPDRRLWLAQHRHRRRAGGAAGHAAAVVPVAQTRRAALVFAFKCPLPLAYTGLQKAVQDKGETGQCNADRF
ncbi:MFS transporter [Janthinobacterium sp.]|uniref:MFS transporter n=1 Tax=Janthinobacterium sp. TaxID=1871054 RepID=UPI0025BC7FCB|nr:MFS transporter [Janthinobacterium sp.]